MTQVDEHFARIAHAYRDARTADLSRLLERARNRHYSTFNLYESEEFEIALDRFTENLRTSYDDLDSVTWRDENTLYLIERTA